jgi:predicted AAA+ superfamily ATPase
MRRNITDKLAQWQHKATRKPLIIRGARQVGKTHSIREFGKKAFPGKFHEINLEKHPDWHAVFKTNFEVKRIITELEVLLNESININSDLLFFDEIQECPEAIAALRYFYEDMPGLHVIAAGSLLEFSLRNIPFPVGRVELLTMYPLTFAEFLLARQQNKLSEIIRQQYQELSPVIHNRLTTELKQYFFIGGMPECVAHFVENQNFMEVREIQNNLINTFRQDFLKYSPSVDTNCLNNVLASITRQVGSQIKYSRLSERFSNPTIKKAFDLLTTAKIITKVSATTPAGIPLQGNVSNKVFKAIFLDIGLLVSLSGLSLKHEYQKTDLLATYRGALAEQFIGQEIRAAGHDMFYWRRNAKSSTAEIDYLLNKGPEIIPIEVKSGSRGRLRSLHLLMAEHNNVKRAIVFLDTPYKSQEGEPIQYLPLYAIEGFLQE